MNWLSRVRYYMAAHTDASLRGRSDKNSVEGLLRAGSVIKSGRFYDPVVGLPYIVEDHTEREGLLGHESIVQLRYPTGRVETIPLDRIRHHKPAV